jgi:hypothetical protein
MPISPNRHAFPTVTLALTATSILAVGCAARPPAGPAAAIAPDVTYVPATRPDVAAPPADGVRVPGVANFGVASADVWRGARPTREGMRNLAAMGVRTVIDLQEDDRSALVPRGVRYVPPRVSGWACDRVDTAAVLRAIADNPKPVFVHCFEGRDRTGLAVGAYQLSRGVSLDVALAELDRFGVHFWWRGPVAARLRTLAAAAKAAPATTRPAGAAVRTTGAEPSARG